MTSPLRLTTALPLVAASALFASGLFGPAPALAGGPDERAVVQCRAELLGRFDEGAIRNYRITEVAGNSRRTRVSFVVNADRRYIFECATGPDGRIVTASFDPPRSGGGQLAAGQR